MDKINFKEDPKGWFGTFNIILLIINALSFIYVIIAFVFNWFQFSNSLINTIFIFGCIIPQIYFKYTFVIYKNVIVWNENGITIKINSIWKKNPIAWDMIKNITYSSDEMDLFIDVLGHRRCIINLRNIDIKSKDRFSALLKKYAQEKSSYYMENNNA